MRVRFLREHQGWETDYRWYVEGDEADLNESGAEALIRCGWAVPVTALEGRSEAPTPPEPAEPGAAEEVEPEQRPELKRTRRK